MVERDLWGRRWKSQLKEINVTFLVSSRVVSLASGSTLGSEPLVYRLGETVSGVLCVQKITRGSPLRIIASSRYGRAGSLILSDANVKHRGFKDIMPILANVAADLLLIHRCYLIWNSPKPLAYTLIFLSVSLNAIGLSSTIVIAIGNHHLYSATNGRQLYTIGNSIVNAYLIAHTVFNGILTVMTAGRIWWITREVRLLMDREMSHKYTGIIAMILESGALYPTFAIAYLIIDATIDPQHTDIRPINLGPLIVLSAAISPTLIIVRAAVGKTVNTVDQVISTLQFAGGNEIRGEGMFERESSEQEKAAV
uniref:Uncharacterized protein n=1 Tax=Moniliophthora roreri TaxID=221103 RepID=A0A0W0FDN3_MONRR